MDFATFDDTGDTATSGLDYTATSGNLTILAGQRTGRVTVPVLNDTLNEPDETFTMELTNPQNAEFAGQAGSVSDTGTITDDSDPETDLRIGNVTVNEGGGTVTFPAQSTTPTEAAPGGSEAGWAAPAWPTCAGNQPASAGSDSMT